MTCAFANKNYEMREENGHYFLWKQISWRVMLSIQYLFSIIFFNVNSSTEKGDSNGCKKYIIKKIISLFIDC